MGIWDGLLQAIQKLIADSGFSLDYWQNYIMIAVGCVLIYLAVVKQYEPLLLLPIAFGMILANLPLAGLMGTPIIEMEPVVDGVVKNYPIVYQDGQAFWQVTKQTGGLLYYLYQGVKLGIYPPLIFLGIGAMTDFGPLIANPKSFLLGAAAQLGIFITFFGAKLLDMTGVIPFTDQQAGSIAIIGGADGPTAIYVTSKPVSYTHLDVYKRQHIRCPAARRPHNDPSGWRICRERRRRQLPSDPAWPVPGFFQRLPPGSCR